MSITYLSRQSLLLGATALCLALPVAAFAADEHEATPGKAQILGSPDNGAEAVAENKPEAPAEETAQPTEEVKPAPVAHDDAAHSGESHESNYELPHLQWSFDGIFGTYDRASLQRGFQVYKEVCSACHSMNRVAYRNLADLGYSEGEIKAIAADAQITDGPNEEGEMFERPGKPSDHFKAPYPNVQAAKASNGGAYPPDLSLIAKARHGGADYIHAILTGYEDAPAGKELLPGQHWNKAMHGNIIAMPAPLTPDRVAYGDGTAQTVDQYAKDVAQFLTWASEPHMEARKRTGIKVFLFLLVFAGIMYQVKKKIWAGAH